MNNIYSLPERGREHLRWIVTVDYLVDVGSVLQEEYHIEELHSLHDLIERGPDWNSIEKIEIVLNPQRRHPVTVEEAASL